MVDIIGAVKVVRPNNYLKLFARCCSKGTHKEMMSISSTLKSQQFIINHNSIQEL